MAENHFKTRIRRILRSCKSKDLIADVAEGHRRSCPELLSPLLTAEDSRLSIDNKIFSTSLTSTPSLLPLDMNGQRCPPSSPMIPQLAAVFGTPKVRKHGRREKKKMWRCSGTCRKCLGFVEYSNGLFGGGEEEGERAALMEAEAAAVVKRSRDPYGDFRASMVEMIVEKQMFGAKDLENLLECFLRLNSGHHHEVIVRVFAEIWEALLL